RSSVKLSRGILKEHDAPSAIMLRGHESLKRVDCRIEVRLPWRHHTSHRAHDSNIGSKEAHASDFRHVSGCRVIGKDLPKSRSNLRWPIEHTSIESDDTSVVSE